MARKISVISLFSAFAILLSYVETFIPSIGVPGAKLGLANIVVVLALYLLNAESAIIVDVVRIVIVGFFHNVGQIIVAMILVDNYSIVYYMPILMIVGIVTGLVIGLLAKVLYERTSVLCKKVLKQ